MNCPQCLQPVGDDRHAFDPWREVVDLDVVIGGIRTGYLFCDHCGYFTFDQYSMRGRTGIYRITRHRSPDVIRRIERKLPALNLEPCDA